MLSHLLTTKNVFDSFKLAVIVGTVLCLINDSYFDGDILRLFLNYLVPFLVSLYSRVDVFLKNKE